MFTGTAKELAEREDRARRIAEQVAALLNQIGDLGLGPATGQITVPGARIQFTGQWVVTR